MPFIQTPSFRLAVYTQGSPAASRLALLLPGRLDTKDYPHMRAHVDFLASRGFYALSFDPPPGTWESPGDIALYTVPNYLKATTELIEHFDNRPTLLMGHSRGGSLAMLAGSENANVSHIVTVFSSFAASQHLDSEIKTGGGYLVYRDLPKAIDAPEKMKFLLPNSYFDHEVEWRGLDTCTKPKLMFLGTKDTVGKPARIRQTFDLAAAPKELHELNSDHEYFKHPALIVEVNQALDRFLDTYSS